MRERGIAISTLAAIVSAAACSPSIAAVVVAPPTTYSLARNYYTSHEIDDSHQGSTATSASLPLSNASADYGRLTAESLGIPSAGGTGHTAYAGAFGQSSVSDTLYLDFGVANRDRGPLSLAVDFTVAGTSPMLAIPPLPADVGWMSSSAGWSLDLPRNWMSGSEGVSRYHHFWEHRTTTLRDGAQTTNGPITGDFSLVIPYDPRGHPVGLVPIHYQLRCGAGNQQIVQAGAQANCLGWSFEITGIHVLDEAGQIVPDVVISAASTYDYNGSGEPILPPSLVPEPLGWALMITGFLAVGTALRRRPDRAETR